MLSILAEELFIVKSTFFSIVFKNSFRSPYSQNNIDRVNKRALMQIKAA